MLRSLFRDREIILPSYLDKIPKPPCFIVREVTKICHREYRCNTMTSISKLVSTIDRATERCSARTMMDKKQAFVKYRDKLPMKFIERWLSRLAKVPVPDEARNVYFRPAKPILLWSSSHTDRRRSTEIGYIDFVSRWNTCICTSNTAEDTRSASSSFS